MPYEDNTLDLDPMVKDPLGYPVTCITADFKDNERRRGAFMQDRIPTLTAQALGWRTAAYLTKNWKAVSGR